MISGNYQYIDFKQLQAIFFYFLSAINLHKAIANVCVGC
ncbi:hypothetical protein XIS1_500012 [Xenorhabdus innexi]|uniref:Uncharacterized protein n=1 Tax=Xenorhabdus innexi TaxID=290109 RepID=A0A1N6MZ10_9GAMM|nr:hypothetical protein XIS1_500012 [Xenorhabdus innexi]